MKMAAAAAPTINPIHQRSRKRLKILRGVSVEKTLFWSSRLEGFGLEFFDMSLSGSWAGVGLKEAFGHVDAVARVDEETLGGVFAGTAAGDHAFNVHRRDGFHARFVD